MYIGGDSYRRLHTNFLRSSATNLQISGHSVGDPFITVTQDWPENEPTLRKK